MVLIKSAARYNPDYKFYVGLVDEKNPSIDYTAGGIAETIPVADLNIDPKYDIFNKYGLIELNTCVKASYFKMLKARHPEAELIIYLDPDIAVFDSLQRIENCATTHDIILTPQAVTPIPFLDDGLNPQESLFLVYGVYNIGFMGLSFIREDSEAYKMLDWWEERILRMGFDEPCAGQFTDQLWADLIPCYYNSVTVLRDFNLNVAPWNIHERKVSKSNARSDKFMVNDTLPIVFFHFSSYNYNNPEKVKVTYNRYTFDKHPELLPLYQWYHTELKQEGIEISQKIKCIFGDVRSKGMPRKKKPIVKRILFKLVPPFVIDAYRYCRYNLFKV